MVFVFLERRLWLICGGRWGFGHTKITNKILFSEIIFDSIPESCGSVRYFVADVIVGAVTILTKG